MKNAYDFDGSTDSKYIATQTDMQGKSSISNKYYKVYNKVTFETVGDYREYFTYQYNPTIYV